MKILGLTGGMGSGKTTVAKFFKELNVPVYIADDEARKLMDKDLIVQEQIRQLFGKEAFKNGSLDRKFVASQVFHDKQKLEQLNQIIHPAVQQHFESWAKQQNSAYVVYEAAILFEKGGYKRCDYNLLVTAPYEEKIRRLLERDNSTLEEITARMEHQWSDEKKAELADFTIKNVNLQNTRKAVKNLHEKLLESA